MCLELNTNLRIRIENLYDRRPRGYRKEIAKLKKQIRAIKRKMSDGILNCAIPMADQVGNQQEADFEAGVEEITIKRSMSEYSPLSCVTLFDSEDHSKLILKIKGVRLDGESDFVKTDVEMESYQNTKYDGSYVFSSFDINKLISHTLTK